MCDQYHGLLPELILDSTIPHRFQLFEALDEFALYRQFSSDTSRNDVRRSWHDQLDATKHYLINHYSIALRLHDSFFGWPELLFNQEDRRLLAKQMVEIIWENTNHRYRSLEYWGPLGQLYAFVILNGLENDIRWNIEAPKIVISTLEDWNKEQAKEEKKFMRRHFKAQQNPVFRSFSLDRSNQGDRMMLAHFS